MERITYRLTLDTHKTGVQKTLQGFQTGDNMARRIVVSLVSGSDGLEIDATNTVAMMYVTEPYEIEPSINHCDIKGNTIIYDVEPIVVDGITEMQIKLIATSATGAKRVLATPKFAVEVSKSGTDDKGAEQTTTFTALEEAVALAHGAYNERLLRIDVDEECTFRAYYADDTVYENDSFKVAIGNYASNAKEYAESASLSEVNAKVSETNAKLSEDNAKESERLAKKYMESASILTPEAYAKVTEDVATLKEDHEELSSDVDALEESVASLTEDVSSLDIKTTNLWELAKSEAGGYKLLSMSGKTVQKTMSGKNLFDFDTFVKNGYSIEFSVQGGKTLYRSSGLGNSSAWGVYDGNGTLLGTFTDFGLSPTKPIVLPSNASYVKVTNDQPTVSALYIGYDSDLTHEPYCGGMPSPNPNYPQSINNVGDCVEMMQGIYSYSTGAFSTSANDVCNKRPISCSSGDTIKIEVETENVPVIVFYSNGNYLSYATQNTAYKTETVVPSGATHFNFYIHNSKALTVEDVGKISLTINGKSVVQFKEENKNFWYAELSGTPSVITFDKDTQTYTLPSGYVGSAIVSNFNSYIPKGAKVTLSILAISGKFTDTRDNVNVTVRNSSGAMIGNPVFLPHDVSFNNNVYSSTFELTDDVMFLRFYKDGSGNTNVTSEIKFKVQLEIGEVATEWVAHKESIATVLLEAPLCETDVMSSKEVVRKRAIKTFNGSEFWQRSYGDGINQFYVSVNGAKNTGVTLCEYYKPIILADRVNNYNTIYSGTDIICVNTLECATVDEWKALLSSRPITVEYELATPTVETLDTTSQIALNSLETFDGVTYINVDSRTLPSEIKGEYGTSKVGAGVLKALNANDTQEIKAKEFITVGTEELDVGVAKLATGSIYIMYE